MNKKKLQETLEQLKKIKKNYSNYMKKQDERYFSENDYLSDQVALTNAAYVLEHLLVLLEE